RKGNPWLVLALRGLDKDAHTSLAHNHPIFGLLAHLLIFFVAIATNPARLKRLILGTAERITLLDLNHAEKSTHFRELDK
ncbi:MAG: hypothetical protein AAFO06_19545, partial [Cyanobacteria bacterium J06597_16]